VLWPNAEDTAALWDFWPPFQWTSPCFIVFRDSRQEGQASQVSFACYFAVSVKSCSQHRLSNNADWRQEAAPLHQSQAKAVCITEHALLYPESINISLMLAKDVLVQQPSLLLLKHQTLAALKHGISCFGHACSVCNLATCA